MNRHKLFLLLALVLLLAGPVLAQTATEPTEIDPDVVNAILNGGVLGFSVVMLTQFLKDKLKLQGGAVVILSFFVSAAVTAGYFLFLVPPFTLQKLIGYSIAVWGTFNGWYIYKKRGPSAPTS